MTLKEAGGSSGPLGGAQPGKAIGCSIHWNEGKNWAVWTIPAGTNSF